MTHNNNLRLTIAVLLEAIETLEGHLPHVPDASCSCHTAPPCNDCVEWSGLRDALATINRIRATVKESN